MSAPISIPRQQSGIISHTNLTILAFATAFFPRVLDEIGFPPIINFLHFAILPTICGFILAKTQTKDREQIAIARQVFLGIFLLLTAIAASAFLNNAGALNIVLDFLLLAEPFMLLLAIVSIPMSKSSWQKLHISLLLFGGINLLLALFQGFILRVDRISPDFVKGVFLGQGSGHVVGGSVSLIFATYYLFNSKQSPLFIRIAVLSATFVHIVKADAKQVLAIFLVALIVFAAVNSRNLARTIQYLAISIIFFGFIIWLADTVFPALKTWADLDIQAQGLELKSSAIPVILSEYKSPLNWLLGLGPGHTVGRLGGWMIEKYYSLLSPLGITLSPVSERVWTIAENHWLGDKSSWFSPLFGWVGIWGDLGFLGLGAYFYLWVVIWQKICADDFSKFLIVNILCFGFVLSQIEEPGYMLYIASIIGLSWQKYRYR